MLLSPLGQMSTVASPAAGLVDDMTGETSAEASSKDRIAQEIERNLLRSRNGLKYFTGGRFVHTAVTPKDIIWRGRKAELWRYRSDQVLYSTPILLYIGLVSRSYIFDLRPGNSFVERLIEAGYDVFLLDWGVADEADAENTLGTYIFELLPRAVKALLRESHAGDLNLISYCMGGCLSLMALGAGVEIPRRSLITMAVPIDFSKMGESFGPICQPDFDVDKMLDDSGNVPASLVHGTVRVRTPTGDAVQYANLWQNLWNDQFLEGFQAMREWIADHVPFPGAAFREVQQGWLADNGFINRNLRVNGRLVDLTAIKGPVLALISARDELVPVDAATPIAHLLTGADLKVEMVPAGHVSLTCGRAAEKHTMPILLDWLSRHSDRLEN
jgi:polyhydroxyalkanoate synthase